MSVLDVRLQTHAPLTEMDIAQLSALGLRVIARMPEAGYRVRGESAASVGDVIALPFVSAATPFHPIEKLAAALASTSQLVAASRTADASRPAGTALASILETPLLVTL